MLERPLQKIYSCMQNDLLEVSPQARKQDEMHRTPLLQRHFTSAQSCTRSQTNGYPTARRLQTRAGTYGERGFLCWSRNPPPALQKTLTSMLTVFDTIC